VCDRAGSSEGVNVCAAPENVPKKRDGLRVLPHPIAGLWNVSVVLPESGSIFERWREEHGRTEQTYDELLAELIPAESGGTAALSGTVHPVIMEIVGLVNGALARLQEAGFPVREMRLSGGQARSPRWNALKARLTHCRLLVPEIIDGELAGAAACAALALGEVATLREACENLVVFHHE
jgi:xylulokinase